MEYIATDREDIYDVDGWVCVCGNVHLTYGFEPCNAGGKLLDLEAANAADPCHWRCCACGRVFREDTLEVVNTGL